MQIKKLLSTLAIILVIAFFAILTFYIIIITRGGKITRDGIIETGIIKLDVSPGNVDYTAYIDSKKVNLNDDLITQLEDGIHTLRIEAPGYTDWERVLKVTKGLVVEVDVRLFPTELTLSQVTNTKVDKVFYSPSREFAYYTVTSKDVPRQDRGIWGIKIARNRFLFSNGQIQPFKLVDMTVQVSKILSNDYEILPDPNDDLLMLKKLNNSQILIFTTDGLSVSPIMNIGKSLNKQPTYIDWFNDGNSLLIKDDILTYELEYESGISTIINYTDEDNVIGWNSSQVLYHNSGSSILQIYEDRKTVRSIDLPDLTSNKIISLAISEEGDLISINTDKELVVMNIENTALARLNKPYQLISSDSELSFFTLRSKNNLYFYNVEQILSTETLIGELTETKVNIFKDKITIIDDEKLAVIQTSEKAYTMDNKAANLVTLLSNSESTLDFVSIDKNGDAIYLVTESMNGNNNIGRIKLTD